MRDVVVRRLARTSAEFLGAPSAMMIRWSVLVFVRCGVSVGGECAVVKEPWLGFTD